MFYHIAWYIFLARQVHLSSPHVSRFSMSQDSALPYPSKLSPCSQVPSNFFLPSSLLNQWEHPIITVYQKNISQHRGQMLNGLFPSINRLQLGVIYRWLRKIQIQILFIPMVPFQRIPFFFKSLISLNVIQHQILPGQFMMVREELDCLIVGDPVESFDTEQFLLGLLTHSIKVQKVPILVFCCLDLPMLSSQSFWSVAISQCQWPISLFLPGFTGLPGWLQSQVPLRFHLF